jgi:hypothetical protein
MVKLQSNRPVPFNSKTWNCRSPLCCEGTLKQSCRPPRIRSQRKHRKTPYFQPRTPVRLTISVPFSKTPFNSRQPLRSIRDLSSSQFQIAHTPEGQPLQFVQPPKPTFGVKRSPRCERGRPHRTHEGRHFAHPRRAYPSVSSQNLERGGIQKRYLPATAVAVVGTGRSRRKSTGAPNATPDTIAIEIRSLR